MSLLRKTTAATVIIVYIRQSVCAEDTRESVVSHSINCALFYGKEMIKQPGNNV